MIPILRTLCGLSHVLNIFKLNKKYSNSFYSHSLGKGIHWFVIFKLHDELEIFDSLSVDNEYIKRHVPPYCQFAVANRTQIQPSSSNLCGQYVVCFITMRLLNLDLEFEDVINSIFTANLQDNDRIVSEFF